MGPGQFAPQQQIPIGSPATAKEKLRQEVMEQYPGDAPGRRNELLAHIRDMSEEQAQNLTSDQQLLRQWLGRA
jgi:hypothetical protein